MTLAAFGWEVELLPALGGAIGSLRFEGRDILRSTLTETDNPLDTACFPLLPYANRIEGGRFDFDGRSIQLPLNFGDHRNSLHGLGWQSEWTAEGAGEAQVALHHVHGAGARWPWPYRAEHRITLSPGRMAIKLALTNLADEAAPVGLGLHPYFPRDAATRLTATSKRLWLADATLLPTEPVEPDRFGDWAQGGRVEGAELIDNAYDGWDGIASIEQSWGRIGIEAHGARVFHLYRPAGVNFFCFEPVSHLPDAINRGGMAMVAPGDTQMLEMALSVEEA